jgi:hypothetical protein
MRRSSLAGAAGLLLAASVALFVVNRSGRLPAYALEMRGGSPLVRSGSMLAPVRLAPGGALELLLRPGVPVHGEVGARVVVAHEGRVYPVLVDFERSDEGSLRGVLRSELLPPGVQGLIELRVLPGRKSGILGGLFQQPERAAQGWLRASVEVAR